MLKISKTKLLRILSLVTVLVAASAAFVFAADPTDITGYHLVYRPLYDYIDTFLEPVCAVLVAVGSVYAIALGVKYAKAEEPQEREKTKVAIKNLIIGFISVFVIYVVWQLLMAYVVVPYAVSQTNNLDADRINVSVEGDDLHTGNYVNDNTDRNTSIKEAREAASDNNATGPTTQQKENTSNNDLGQPGEESNPSYDPNSSMGTYGSDGNVTPNQEQVDPLETYVTQVKNATANFKSVANDASSDESKLTNVFEDLKTAISNLESAISQYGSTDTAANALNDAKKVRDEAQELWGL